MDSRQPFTTTKFVMFHEHSQHVYNRKNIYRFVVEIAYAFFKKMFFLFMHGKIAGMFNMKNKMGLQIKYK